MVFYHSRPRPNRAAHHVPTDPALESIVSAAAIAAHAGDSDYGDPSAETDRPTAEAARSLLPWRRRSLSSSPPLSGGNKSRRCFRRPPLSLGASWIRGRRSRGIRRASFSPTGKGESEGREREQKFPLDGAITRSKEEGRKEEEQGTDPPRRGTERPKSVGGVYTSS